ncbi:MAG TPA: CoA-binding protein [Candidatus Saccharimonadales bacterium]|nr:CoA-binding protein [Candidatus Saccharimonadales bacterium]
MQSENVDNTSDARLRQIYGWKNVAVVGMSATEGKPANYVPKYLIEKGYNVIPVNPNYDTILGLKSYSKVSDIPNEVDIVDVFRKSEDVLPIAKDLVLKKGIKVLWLQLGIHNQQAQKTAEENGIEVVYNRCMLREHQRLFP